MLLKDTPEGHSLQAPAEMENGSPEMRLGSLYDRPVEARKQDFHLKHSLGQKEMKISGSLMET